MLFFYLCSTKLQPKASDTIRERTSSQGKQDATVARENSFVGRNLEQIQAIWSCKIAGTKVVVSELLLI